MRGLRREEVAELAGVSAKWYALFEGGATRRFSPRFVGRVADVLRLNVRERAALYRLALPDIAEPLTKVGVRDGVLGIAQLYRFVRKVESLGEYRDAAIAAADAFQEIVGPDCLSLAWLADDRGDVSGYATGPRAQSWTDVNDEMAVELYELVGRGGVGVIQHAPLPEEVAGTVRIPVTVMRVRPRARTYHFECEADRWRRCNGRLRARRGLIVPLFEGETVRGFLGAAWLVPGHVAPIDIDVMEILASVVRLATARETIPRRRAR